MSTGYRRAGFALVQGENSLEVNQEQYQALTADKNLTVAIVDGELAQADIGTHVKSEGVLAVNIEQLRNENSLLLSQVDALTKLCEGQEEAITNLEEKLDAVEGITHEDTLTDLASIRVVVDDGEELDVSSAPEELHHWIAIIDDINKEGNLTKKPNCDHLTITVDGESLTPSAAERDAAWAWYQENVVIASIADVNTRETGE
jgi:hypothetical protein